MMRAMDDTWTHTAFEVLRHTPLWVWGFLCLLVWIGWRASHAQSQTLGRAAFGPIALCALSLLAGARTGLLAWAAWAGAASLTCGLLLVWQGWTQAHWNASTRRIERPGSWGPMAWMLSVFCFQYSVAVAQALQPALRLSTGFALFTGLVSGAVTGLFLSRLTRLARLAWWPDTQPKSLQA
jgi:hypothetical protein